jgi:leucyl aminopeptidase (aminopeptidase T)
MPSSQLDSLYRSVARKVLTETLRLRKGESLTVETWNNGLGFARIAVAEARAMGCNAAMILEDEQAYVEGVKKAPKDVLGTMGKNEYGLLSGSDAYIFVPGQALAVYSKTLTPTELVDSTRYNASWYEAAKKAGLRGARLVFGYAGKDMARMLGKSVDDVVKGQLKAVLTDYASISKQAWGIAPRFADGTEVTLDSGGAVLRLTMKGEMEVEDGIVDERDVAEGGNMTYMPPGLVTKEVDPSSANGRVKVSQTLTKLGLISGAELEFKEGKLTSWKSRDAARLGKVLDGVPEEKRRVTLMGVGLNPVLKYGFGQDRFVKGTVTLAGLGFTPVVRKGTLSAGPTEILSKGNVLA